MIRLTMVDARRLGLNISVATPLTRHSPATPRRRSGRLPDKVLWTTVSASYPDAQREYKGAVPGRRFRIDIALVDEKIAIEVDGWQYHGKFKSAHQSDRERQNLLAVQGWLVLRFTSGLFFKDLCGVSATIGAAVMQRRAAW